MQTVGCKLLEEDQMTQNENYKVLSETEELVLGHVFEDAYLTTKKSGETISLGDFYGHPDCGLISRTNDWCIVCGPILVVWTKNNISRIECADLNRVFDIRQSGSYTVQLLIDPWAANSAIWECNITTKEKCKIRDFPDYKDKEYTDNVKW